MTLHKKKKKKKKGTSHYKRYEEPCMSPTGRSKTNKETIGLTHSIRKFFVMGYS